MNLIVFHPTRMCQSCKGDGVMKEEGVEVAKANANTVAGKMKKTLPYLTMTGRCLEDKSCLLKSSALPVPNNIFS